MAKYTFKDLWLTEAVRLREEHWGPLDDSSVLHQIRQVPGDLADKISQRALTISRREGLHLIVERWIGAAKVALFVLFLLALMAGITSGLSALDTARNHVNILLSLVALLGLHIITYVVWLLSLITPIQSNTLIGGLWLWLSKKLARSAETNLAAQALISTANQQRSMRWILSTISHGFWLVLLCAATMTLLAMLAAKSYTFGWETTILSSQRFVSLTQTLGGLPHLIGFAQPDAALVQASGNQIMQDTQAQTTWSSWLIGQVMVWGIILRLLSFVFCAVKARTALRRTHIDPTLPVYSSLINRLQTRVESLGIDLQAPAYQVPSLEQNDVPLSWHDRRLLVGVELSPSTQWPPFALTPGIHDLGIIESREQRHQLLAQMNRTPIKNLLLVCDAQQTPDRGVMHFLTGLASHAQHPEVLLINAQNTQSTRLQQWQDTLSAGGFKDADIFTQGQPLSSWSQT